MPNGKSPSKLWAVIAREYGTRVKSRWFLVSTVFAPLVLGLLVYLPMSLSARQFSAVTALYNVSVIDVTTTGVGERIAQILGGGKYANQPMPEVKVVPSYEVAQAESLALRNAEMQRTSGYLVIDSTTLQTGAAHYVGRLSTSKHDMYLVKDAIREGLIGHRLAERGLGSQTIDSITIVEPDLRADPLGGLADTGAEGKVLVAIALAFVMYMSIILYSQSILGSVVEEKSNRVAEVVLSSVKPNTLLAGKVIGVSAVGLTQQLIWLAMGGAILFAINIVARSAADPLLANTAAAQPSALTMTFQMLPLGALGLFLVFFLLGFLFFGSLYAAAGSTVNNESDSRYAAQPIIILLVASVLFIQPVAMAPNSTLSVILSLIPFSSPVLMPLRVAATHVPLWEIAASVVILAASCYGAVRIAAKIYRVGLLMYGKRPTLAEVWRWI